MARRPMASLDLRLKSEMVQDNIPAQVIDKVWIGSIHSAFNLDGLLLRHISHIVNASSLPATFPGNFTYLNVYLRDKEDTNILGATSSVSIFIEAGIEKGGVLVHCVGGRSRSAAFISAFLMTKKNFSLDHALKLLKTVRPVVSINRGFEQQLKAFEATQFNLYKANQMIMRARLQRLSERRNRILACRPKLAESGHDPNLSNKQYRAVVPPQLSPCKQPPEHIVRILQRNLQEHRLSRRVNTDITCSDKNYLPTHVRQPHIRLCRPGTKSQQLGCALPELGNIYVCKSCGAYVFTQGNILDGSILLPDLATVSQLNTLYIVKQVTISEAKTDHETLSEQIHGSKQAIHVPDPQLINHERRSTDLNGFETKQKETKFDMYSSDKEPAETTVDDSNWIYIEYLSWMGDLVCVSESSGDLLCPNFQCNRNLGKWSWNSGTLGGPNLGISCPTIALNKSMVTQSSDTVGMFDSHQSSRHNTLSEFSTPNTLD